VAFLSGPEDLSAADHSDRHLLSRNRGDTALSARPVAVMAGTG